MSHNDITTASTTFVNVVFAHFEAITCLTLWYNYEFVIIFVVTLL